jgi:hypothetical protein
MAGVTDATVPRETPKASANIGCRTNRRSGVERSIVAAPARVPRTMHRYFSLTDGMELDIAAAMSSEARNANAHQT